MAMLSAGKVRDAFAVIAVSPLYFLFRNTGWHRPGRWSFGVLHFSSYLVKSIWPQLNFQSAVGLADEMMLLRQENAIQLAKRSLEMAKTLNDDTYLCLATYQMGHTMAHFHPSKEAEGLRVGVHCI
jgi:hypothetical protein